MDRNKAIAELNAMNRQMGTQLFIRPTDARREALEMGAASLKTDEAYQLEYENRDCVEVVRCKDCKHYRGNSCEWHNGFKPPVDWFCADGERE